MIRPSIVNYMVGSRSSGDRLATKHRELHGEVATMTGWSYNREATEFKHEIVEWRWRSDRVARKSMQ